MSRDLEKAFTEQARQLFGLCSLYLDGSYSPDDKDSLLEQITDAFDNWRVDLRALFEEIIANLEEPMSEQQRERYCFSLITPFEAFSNTLYPKWLISKSQESIDRLQGVDGADKMVSIFEKQIEEANRRAKEYWSLGYSINGLTATDEAKSVFFELAQIITSYGNMLDAAFVLNGLDLKHLQEMCSVWVKQFIGGDCAIPVRALQIKYYIGSEALAEEYLRRLLQEQPEPQRKDLHYYCQRAIEKGYLVKADGGYKRATWSKALLAYFLKHFLNTDGTFPDKEYCVMFGESRLSKAADQLSMNRNGDGKPRGYEKVDELLQE